MRKPPEALDARDIERLAASIDAEDLARARSAISGGVKAAEEQWLPVHLIASALAMELQDYVLSTNSGADMASYLHQLAELVSLAEEKRGYH